MEDNKVQVLVEHDGDEIAYCAEYPSSIRLSAILSDTLRVLGLTRHPDYTLTIRDTKPHPQLVRTLEELSPLNYADGQHLYRFLLTPTVR